MRSVLAQPAAKWRPPAGGASCHDSLNVDFPSSFARVILRGCRWGPFRFLVEASDYGRATAESGGGVARGPIYSDAERAALELAEEGTRIADGKGISDDVRANALLNFSEDEIVALVPQIVLINAFNRLNVIFGRPGGDYVVGQFG